jgi:hypothetical protein
VFQLGARPRRPAGAPAGPPHVGTSGRVGRAPVRAGQRAGGQPRGVRRARRRGVRARDLPHSDATVANRNGRDFGWGVAHGAVSRRPPISLYTMLPYTAGYAYDVGVWDLSIVQEPLSVAPCQTLRSRFATFFLHCMPSSAPPRLQKRMPSIPESRHSKAVCCGAHARVWQRQGCARRCRSLRSRRSSVEHPTLFSSLTKGAFGGRFDALGQDDTSDCDGHGTHTAGVAAGAIYGIAPQLQVRSDATHAGRVLQPRCDLLRRAARAPSVGRAVLHARDGALGRWALRDGDVDGRRLLRGGHKVGE